MTRRARSPSKGSKLKPAIRAILERTRKARAELDAFIKEAHGPATPDCDNTQAAPASADTLAGRGAPQLDDGGRRSPPRDPDPAPQPKPDRRRPPAVPARDDRNTGRRKGTVRPPTPQALKDVLIALFKNGKTIEQVLVVHPTVSKGTLVAIKANVTRGAYK
jgi:hypothetical protein